MRLESYDLDGKLVHVEEVPDLVDDFADAKATLKRSLDPDQPSPTTGARLDALERLLAAQVLPEQLP